MAANISYAIMALVFKYIVCIETSLKRRQDSFSLATIIVQNVQSCGHTQRRIN